MKITFLFVQVYLERLLTYAELDMTPASWRRMVLGATLLASKVILECSAGATHPVDFHSRYGMIKLFGTSITARYSKTPLWMT